MRRTIMCVGITLLANSVSAQVQHGGEPVQWGAEQVERSATNQIALPALDEQQVADIPSAPEEAGHAFQFGTNRPIAADVLADGTWSTLADERQVCRLSIKSPGAAMLSLQFSSFEMASGAQLYLYNAGRDHFLGSFTEQNELPTGRWATRVIPGDEIVVEYIQPANVQSSQSSLVISGLTHGVVDIFNFHDEQPEERDYYPGYPAAACQVNVGCPEGAGWDQVAGAVALFLRPDGHGCTGSLINNTRNDGTPYFYLANHCNLPPHDQWVFYFNYEAPLCGGDTGRTDQTVVGANLRAAEHFSDFTLLELFDEPQQFYDVYYAGWDRSGVIPTSSTIIMHPAYDVKKIALDNDPAANGTGTTLDPDVLTWVTDWDVGFAEFGSSGSSVFDQNKRIVGLVTEAWGDCSALGGVSASRFSEQWDGVQPGQRLRDWLDPDNTGQTTINGHNPAAAALAVPVKVFLKGPFDAATGLMKDDLRAATLIPTTEPYTALGFAHFGEGGTEQTTAQVLSTTGSNAVVDWVFVELRDKNSSTTVVSTRSALLLRNGSVVEPDGTPLTFLVAADDYFVSVRHRNHLGIMTAQVQSISAATPAIDLTLASGPALYGGNSIALDVLAGKQVMAPGDAVIDNDVKYVGQDNDRDQILVDIGGTIPTNVVSGYYTSDTNLDGLVKYTGAANDRDVILISFDGGAVNTVRSASLP